MKCLHFHIEGQVQGVGFRPTVYRLATGLHLGGWVCNNTDGVHIEVEGTANALNLFIDQVQKWIPAVARVTNITIQSMPIRNFSGFNIVHSQAKGTPALLITPDIALCENCREEIYNETDRRYQYPFTTCTQCGPRYSILRDLPYDRQATSMAKFEMCEKCEKEYETAFDRRFYSQTNSCPVCSIQSRLLNGKGEELAATWNDAFPILISALHEGKSIAVKGIGGYLLLADACNAEAIKTLRLRKHRPSKPFALMYPDIETLRSDVELQEDEIAELTSEKSPILLLTLKQSPATGLCASLIAPQLNTIGVMMPYTAMFALISRKFENPLIATSANVSSSPIFYKDVDVVNSLNTVADLFLVHNREIEVPQDDSVLRLTPHCRERIVLRRSRGLAPTVVKKAFSNETILAMGADVKSTFTIQSNGRIYVSQYLGDLESYECQANYRKVLFHLLSLLNTRPEKIIIDSHPNYFSSFLGRELARAWSIPVTAIQHHKAHAFAVLAENDLLDSNTPILCVVWDGTGYGDDHNIWGGEFFNYYERSLSRVGRLEYMPQWLGDKMAVDTRLAALFFCRNSEWRKTYLAGKFSSKEWGFYTNLLNTRPALFTSSMGRLFDAIACITGVCDHNSFEGEAAMLLEAIAVPESAAHNYPVTWKKSVLCVDDLLNQVVRDVIDQVPVEKISYKFHVYLADVVHSVVAAKRYRKIAFSGGVFQNALLVDLIIDRLKDYDLFFHKELSPNDENISFGQMAAKAVDKRITVNTGSTTNTRVRNQPYILQT